MKKGRQPTRATGRNSRREADSVDYAYHGPFQFDKGATDHMLGAGGAVEAGVRIRRW